MARASELQERADAICPRCALTSSQPEAAASRADADPPPLGAPAAETSAALRARIALLESEAQTSIVELQQAKQELESKLVERELQIKQSATAAATAKAAAAKASPPAMGHRAIAAVDAAESAEASAREAEAAREAELASAHAEVARWREEAKRISVEGQAQIDLVKQEAAQDKALALYAAAAEAERRLASTEMLASERLVAEQMVQSEAARWRDEARRVTEDGRRQMDSLKR